MAKPTVYIETTIVGYLTMRPKRGILTTGMIQTTRQWWDRRRNDFALYISQAVLAEIGKGDARAAAERVKALEGITALSTTVPVTTLAEALLAGVPLPERAAVDAVHVAIAAVHGIDYLLTWNCKHISNAMFRPKMQWICMNAGYNLPTICSPLELMEKPYA